MSAIQNPYSVVIELLPDELDGSLETPTPISIAEGSERALYKEHRNVTLECRVVHLQEATLHGGPAVLICFEFNFIAAGLSSSRRIVSADIDISFECEAPAQAHVVNYAPALVEGPLTEVMTQRERLFKPNAGISAPSAPVQVGFEVGFSERLTFIDRHAFKMQGSASSSDTRSELHRARWQVKENRATKIGIPSVFRVAALVRTKERAPMQCSLRLEVLSGRRRLLGVPWSSKSPLVVEPAASVGNALHVEGMKDRDWEELLRISYPVAVLQLTRESARVAALPHASLGKEGSECLKLRTEHLSVEEPTLP